MQFYTECLGVNEKGRLAIGGADVTEIAKEFGTPCYIMDEAEIRKNCRAYTGSMKACYPGEFRIAYASKALSFAYMYKLCHEENVGADVVSGGELYTALKGGMPASSLYFHGNNKTEAELRYAAGAGVHCIVLDNPEELGRLDRLAGETGRIQPVSVRLRPGVKANTHSHVQTGQITSKFGVAIETGEALSMIRNVLACKNVSLIGVHCHIGSQIFDQGPFDLAVSVLMGFMAEARKECGIEMKELNLGGGFGIQYTPEDDPRDIETIVRATAQAVQNAARELDYPLPCVVLEPGRSIAAGAGITVYTIGSVKDIPGAGLYLLVDGGMTDNIRYALYRSRYQALLPARAGEPQPITASIAGRCCESGDFVGKDMPMQANPQPGDLVAVLATGAYNYALASNYNRVPRPPVVMIRDGAPFAAVRRETWEDVARLDVI